MLLTCLLVFPLCLQALQLNFGFCTGKGSWEQSLFVVLNENMSWNVKGKGCIDEVVAGEDQQAGHRCPGHAQHLILWSEQTPEAPDANPGTFGYIISAQGWLLFPLWGMLGPTEHWEVQKELPQGWAAREKSNPGCDWAAAPLCLCREVTWEWPARRDWPGAFSQNYHSPRDGE